jgi:hypothetical protein
MNMYFFCANLLDFLRITILFVSVKIIFKRLLRFIKN